MGTIIDALREIGPGDWTCKIAGQAMDDSIERFIAQSEGLPIEFVGWVDPKTFFDEIDVLIVPSIWAEPSPRTIYEAYAVGVPCIGARTGGIPELIGEDNNDWLFAGGDHKELATRIRNVMAKGRESFPPQSEFQWVLDESTSRRVAEKFEALYKEVLEAPRAG
ncbi:glycosyltransferase [Caulobacter sp. UC70_42]|uniref:glycosyltransferase n=1 Tax=Caulobacter sp. UC70_42 TaxID=3374551 RepID=UPI003757E5A8